MKILSIMPMNNKYLRDNYAVSNNTNYASRVSSSAQVNFSSSLLPDNLPCNFGTVIEGKLFRGSFPKTRKNFEAFQQLGVKFIMNLCGLTDEEKALAKEFNIELIHIDGENFATNKEKLLQAEKIIEYKLKMGKVGYVHCDQGATKTGLLVADYQLNNLENLEIPPEKVKDQYFKHKGDPVRFYLFGYSHFPGAPFSSIFEY